MKPTDFSKYLNHYLVTYLPGLRNVSQNTILSYCDTFRMLLEYIRDMRGIPIERVKLRDIDSDLICAYLDYLEHDRACSISTRNQRLACIHSFMRYAQSEAPDHILQCQKVLEIPTKKKGKPLVKYLTSEDMKLILSGPDTSTCTGRRDLALLCVLYDTGGRVQEIADLTVRDVRLAAPASVRLTGKGRKSRLIPIVGNTMLILQSYIQEQRLTSPDKLDHPLFFNSRRQKLTRAGIAYVLDKYVQQASRASNLIPKPVTPHILRHSKAMHLLQAGVNIIYIRDFLGHADIKTTEVYARADPETRRVALENVHSPTPDVISPWIINSDLLGWLKSYGRSAP